MAHHELQAGAPNLPLKPGMILRLEARSPTTDAAVTGVTSSRWTIYGYDESEGLSRVEDVIPMFTAQGGGTA